MMLGSWWTTGVCRHYAFTGGIAPVQAGHVLGDYQVPRKVTEGLIHGASREDRLKITVTSMDFER